MGRIFGLVMLLVAMAVGMTVYTQGAERAFGGAFAPIEPVDTRESPHATALSPAAQQAEAPSGGPGRVRVTDAVRQRVSQDLEEGARRRGY